MSLNPRAFSALIVEVDFNLFTAVARLIRDELPARKRDALDRPAATRGGEVNQNGQNSELGVAIDIRVAAMAQGSTARNRVNPTCQKTARRARASTELSVRRNALSRCEL